MPKTTPDYLQSPLSAESAELREKLESNLDQLYQNLKEVKGVHRLRVQRQIDVMEERLSWQGANPKEIPLSELREHIGLPHHGDPIIDKYQQRIRNRATAIRAYCVMCQGGTTVGVKECPSVTCPLYPFRTGSDPLRGYELPKAAPVVVELDDDVSENLFEEDDDAEEADAIE